MAEHHDDLGPVRGDPTYWGWSLVLFTGVVISMFVGGFAARIVSDLSPRADTPWWPWALVSLGALGAGFMLFRNAWPRDAGDLDVGKAAAGSLAALLVSVGVVLAVFTIRLATT